MDLYDKHINLVWDVPVGLDKYIDWVLPALELCAQDIIKPQGIVSRIKVNIPTPSSGRMISSKFV